MASPAANAIIAGHRANAQLRGARILYARGDARIDLPAAFGNTEYAVDAAGAVRIEHTDRDFIFEAAEFVLQGELATPQIGDRITVIGDDGAYGDVFEVMAPPGLQCYHLSGQGILVRVHGKRVQ